MDESSIASRRPYDNRSRRQKAAQTRERIVVNTNTDSVNWVQENGNIAAPPKNLSHTASWWNAGPKPGSDAGKAVISVHTYRNGGALGNEMYSDEDGPALQPGDIIRLTSKKGKVQCYEFTGATKVWVKDYDPDSDDMVDFHGDPQLLIIICWDFNKETEDWDSRIFFHATPVE